jgi:PPK2 family polyphosphate:nucleotide phosphotransferase
MPVRVGEEIQKMLRHVRHRVPADGDIRLSDCDPSDTGGMDEAQCGSGLERNIERIAELQNVLYAEKKRALLVVLQSMDTGGKDPIIRDVLYSANPIATRVTAFKKATDREKLHDYFWRFHKAVPARGEIGVFNRSHYDEIIRENAHGSPGGERRDELLRQINDFERILTGNDIHIVKLYLHMSKDEQRKRLQERLDDPHRHWELSESDFEERKHWDGYMQAFEEAIRKCNSDEAPWFLIPSNKKWYRDFAASEIIVAALEELRPEFPPASFDLSKVSLD